MISIMFVGGVELVTYSESKLRGFWNKGYETKVNTIERNVLNWNDPVIISREIETAN